ncbi:MAG: amidohydrolase family protein [Myxococcales bacterium]|nr:amidohydrolase [Myxococcota bacterium]MDW8283737.1 amidohydrolase family protein [Myxococcales bacterium]
MRSAVPWVLALVGLAGCKMRQPPAASHSPSAAPFRRADIPRIDVHTHIALGAGIRAARLLERYGIVHAVNLSGPPPDHGLADFVADADVAYGRLTVFTNPNWSYCNEPAYGVRMAADLVRARDLGARGLKIAKALGLSITGPDGKLLAVDDPGLDPLFQKAGELGMPVAIHTGDPKAFWEEPSEQNERFDELKAHPEWSFWEEHRKGLLPSWQELFDAFVRRVARHPRTIFIGVHFGNNPEDPRKVAELLDRFPNLYIDLAARVPAIGRRDAAHDQAAMRAFFIKYQDRILLGTDTGVGHGPHSLMFGSTGTEPPTERDADRFFESTWRYLETADRDIPSPTPIQGRWNIDGVGLPREVLEKIYYRNAQRLLGIKLPKEPLPPQHRGIP